MTFGDTAAGFTGTIYIATGGATLFPGKAFTASVTDRLSADDKNPDGTPNDEALRAQLTFVGGRVDSLQLDVDTLAIRLGDYVTITARDFALDTGASASEYLASFRSVGAVVQIGSLELSGEARNFGFRGRRQLQRPAGLRDLPLRRLRHGRHVQVAVVPAGADRLDRDRVGRRREQPGRLRPRALGERHRHQGRQRPGVLRLHPGRADPAVRCSPGQFPIISIDSLGVTVKGKMFGGTIEAGLVGGILRLDPSFTPIGEFDRTTPVAKRVFYLGLQGGFSMAGMSGFTIRIGLSELGPLQVFINVEVPGGVLLEPISGLTLNDFSAGVEFFKSLPSIDDPFALRSTAFGLPTNLTAAEWPSSLQQQVALQAKPLDANPDMNGFAAAFTAPMTITGSARIYSIYTSQAVFNGLVTIKISTDGKFLIQAR